uniref:Aminopeptidase N-like N-terminal domain-containing protein n=1 Tax=Plectus sambesii TaxID=2011161 RepID=A0A914W834_9BILA
MARTGGNFDPCSCANTDQFRVVDFDVEWLVDFDKHILSGSVDLQIYAVSAGGNTLYLDVRDLDIKSINVNGNPTSFSYEAFENAAFGAKLLIAMPICSQGDFLSVLIRYDTSSHASALQWMPTEMTADKKQPYLFSQCQEIHARSILPCMDTPSVKQNFTAKVTVPCQMTALMGALRQGSSTISEDGLYRTFAFAQPVPIPTYLLALVVGVLEKRDISTRCAVWAEPSLIERAAEKLADVEKVLYLAEDLLGAYVWGRYDTVTLPAWFPYRGMENPCL